MPAKWHKEFTWTVLIPRKQINNILMHNKLSRQKTFPGPGWGGEGRGGEVSLNLYMYVFSYPGCFFLTDWNLKFLQLGSFTQICKYWDEDCHIYYWLTSSMFKNASPLSSSLHFLFLSCSFILNSRNFSNRKLIHSNISRIKVDPETVLGEKIDEIIN